MINEDTKLKYCEAAVREIKKEAFTAGFEAFRHKVKNMIEFEHSADCDNCRNILEELSNIKED